MITIFVDQCHWRSNRAGEEIATERVAMDDGSTVTINLLRRQDSSVEIIDVAVMGGDYVSWRDIQLV